MLKFYTFIFCIVVSANGFGQISFEYDSPNLELDEEYGATNLGGGGVTFFDFDQDGLDDLSMATTEGDSINFYKNMGGYFEKIQPTLVENTSRVKSIIWADYDNDGDYDLVVTGYESGCFLYQNQGDLTFIDVSADAGITADMAAFQSATWGDINNDGDLDLYVTTNDNATFQTNYLYKNNGDGSFEDITISAGVSDSTKSPFGMVFSDVDDDGDQDMYLAIDHNYGNSVFLNNGDDTFTDVTETCGGGLELFSMCIAAGDYDNDGDEDFYFTNMLPVGSLLSRSNGDGTFSEESQSAGLNWLSDGWGSSWFDADLDGDLDLFMVGCHNILDGYESSAFYENEGDGTFTKLTDIGFENDTIRSYSVAVGDLDSDGYPDIVVNNEQGFNLTFWHNTTSNDNHFLKIKLEGVTNSKDAIGSWIEVYNDGEMQRRYTHTANGYLSQNTQYEIFGLGENESVDSIRVLWLNGLMDVAYEVEADQELTLIEGFTANGINELDLHSYKVYPNPSNGIINIELSNDFPAINSIKLTSIDGRITRYEERWLDPHHLRMNTHGLSSGMYVITIQTNSGLISEYIMINSN